MLSWIAIAVILIAIITTILAKAFQVTTVLNFSMTSRLQKVNKFEVSF